jgi:NADPH:quinone reductase-like Zn-dependent oxidoreductase
LIGILKVDAGDTVLIRGATSALGQAAVNIAAAVDARVIATTRKDERAPLLLKIGAHEVLIESPQLSNRVRASHPKGVDAVLDIVGNTTVLDSLAALRRGGAVCEVGFLGGGGPLTVEPVFQIPSGRHFTTFASAVVTGGPEFPLSEIPVQTIVDRVARGEYKAEPARVFRFDQIQEAHRVMDAGTATGKLVVTVDGG